MFNLPYLFSFLFPLPFFSLSPLSFPYFYFRLKMAQESVSKLTSEKKVETKKINPTASLVRYIFQRNLTIVMKIEVRPGRAKAQR